MQSLADRTAVLLERAGFTYDDPDLAAVRAWNEAAQQRQHVSVEVRRGQFGKTRGARLDELERML